MVDTDSSGGDEFRGRIYDNILETIGATPLIRLHRMAAEVGCKAVIPMWPGHSSIQYYGNLAGDAAWTAEAAIMLVVPILIESAAKSRLAAAKKAA